MTALTDRFPLPGILLFVVACLLFPERGYSQWMGEYLGDESALYAETKQVNQFFRRFNCEEALDGKRFYPKDSLYHNLPLRKQYLNILFDASNPSLEQQLKRQFISEATSLSDPFFLDFHGGNWFAEVTTTFLYKGEEMTISLFMEIEKAEVGSKWVFTNVFFEPFSRLFQADTGEESVYPFLHPLSHELDFMNLIKVFRDEDQVEKYALKGYQPDYLTLFLYEFKLGNLSFKTINKVKFHFFQMENWYFELKEFNRPGRNRGWLISQMTRIPEGQKEILLKYIYNR